MTYFQQNIINIFPPPIQPFQLIQNQYYSSPNYYIILRIEIMQPLTPRPEGSFREKPLQHSMILSNQQPTSLLAQRPQLIDTFNLNSFKRSSLPVPQNTMTPISPTFCYNQNQTGRNVNKPFQNIPLNSPSGEIRTQSHYEFSNTNGYTGNAKLINSANQGEKQRRTLNNSTRNQLVDQPRVTQNEVLQKNQAHLFNQIIDLIKDKHINQWLGSLKTQIMNEINGLKAQIQTIKAECSQQQMIQAAHCKQFKLQIAKLVDCKTNFTNPANSKIKKQNDTSELEKQIQSIQERMGLLQNKFGDSFTQFISQLQKLNLSQNSSQNKQPKISPIKSSLPPIVLEYRQFFVIKKEIQASSRQKIQEIMLTAEHYYIDKNGYLLDGESHYLLDSNNQQIRLQQKHLLLLESHKILQR